jgi:hypothetical protein
MIIVSGHRRSGTSAMMAAMYAGMSEGQVLYMPAQERLNQPLDGYQPNPGDLYEIGRAHYMNAAFLRTMPDDGLVKVLWDGLPNLPAGNYTIIFMERDEAEINASIARSDAHLRARGVKENAQTHFTFDIFRPYDRENVDHVLGIMEQRKDVDLIKVNFKDLIENPEWVFERIRHTPLGRPRMKLDVAKAAAIINPDYYRVRIDSADNESRGVKSPAESISNEQPAA